MIFWNIIIGLAAFALQLLLTPKPQNAKPASLEDFDLPVAEEGIEIPVLFGTDYFKGPNVTWYGDLKIREIKGARRYGLFGPRQVIGHKYSLGIQMGLCHGPVDNLQEIWVGEKLAWSGTSTGGIVSIDLPDLFGGEDREGGIVGNVAVCMGAPSQGQNAYLVGILGATLSAFRGVVTIVLQQVYVGTNAYIKPWEFKLQRIHVTSAGVTQWYDAKAAIATLDMNPAHIIRECLTDATWGMGYNSSDIDDASFTYAADVFYNEGFGMTLKWATESPIEDFISMVQSHVDAYLYTSRTTGKFVLKPIRLDYDINTIPVFTEDDIIEWEEISRRQPTDANTSVTVKYTDRLNRGKQASHTFHNDAQVQQSGGVVLATRNYAGISSGSLAARVAQRDQKSLSAGMISGRIKCKRIVEGLNPGDPFRLISDRHNLEGEVMRVGEITYAGGRTNAITIQFVEDVFNLGAEELIDTSQGDWENPANPASAVDPRLVWEMPYRELTQMIGPADADTLLAGDPDAGMLQASGGQPTPDALDAIIYVDGTQQEIMTFAPAGLLIEDIGAFDTAITITVGTNLTLISDGMLAAIEGTTPATTEIIRIDSRDGDDLTVSRGMVDSVPRIHAAGAALIVFDDAGMSDYEVRTAGDTPDVQLATRTPVNTLSIGLAPIDEVTLDSRAIRPLRPANVKVEGFLTGPVSGAALSEFTTTWSERNRLTELGTALAWTDATVAAEAGQTTIIEVLDPDYAILTTYSGLTGITHDVPIAAFGSELFGWIRVGAERDGYREWQAYAIQVIVVIGAANGLASGTSTALAVSPVLAVGAAAGSGAAAGVS